MYITIIDTKLLAYNLKHRKQSITELFNYIGGLIENITSDKIIFVSDIGKSSYRLAEQSYYKGNRRVNQTEEEVEDHKRFTELYNNLIQLSKFLPINVVDVKELEADDQASIIATRLSQKMHKVTMVTRDMDWYQIVLDNNNVRMFDPVTTTFTYKEDIIDEFNVTTKRQFCILKSLAGDAGDNIVFLKNFGKVKASQFMEELLAKYECPTDKQAIKEVEELVKEKGYELHPLHIQDGRTTIEEAFISNMKVATTFTDQTHFTLAQDAEFAMSKVREEGSFEDESIKLLGFPIILDDKARKVFNV